MVVRVEQIYIAGDDLRNQQDQFVTVVVAGEPSPAPGRRLVFFTNPMLFSETMAVREVGHVEQPDDVDALERLMEKTEIEMADELLRDHVVSTEAIVLGRVQSVRHVSTTTIETMGEHDPDWWAGTIRVSRSLKGDIGAEIEVRFPTSRDRRWYQVPRLHDGDEGIFLLHRDGQDDGGVHLALIHLDDFIPGDDARVQRDRPARVMPNACIEPGSPDHA